jgi:hypothetical protein
MGDQVSGASGQNGSGEATERVAGAAHNAVDQAARAAQQTQDALGEVRGVIRAQPITAALVVFMAGYLLGRLGALIPSGSRRAGHVR